MRCSGKNSVCFFFSGKWQTAKNFLFLVEKRGKLWCWAQKNNTVYILWQCCWCCFRRRNKNNKKKKNNDENGIEKQEGKCCLGVILSRKGKMKKKFFIILSISLRKREKKWENCERVGRRCCWSMMGKLKSETGGWMRKGLAHENYSNFNYFLSDVS